MQQCGTQRAGALYSRPNLPHRPKSWLKLCLVVRRSRHSDQFLRTLASHDPRPLRFSTNATLPYTGLFPSTRPHLLPPARPVAAGMFGNLAPPRSYGAPVATVNDFAETTPTPTTVSVIVEILPKVASPSLLFFY
ncbi:hypothetical protein B0H13DRAFT_2342988 [Mycena leptocephala]|nr:hypothetical protein B0H13DRAFT_2342988 [Mycena leptocephala]